jgi:hypothetical protein
MFTNFEDIHKNKKLAFLDGALCGLVAAYIWHMFTKVTEF